MNYQKHYDALIDRARNCALHGPCGVSKPLVDEGHMTGFDKESL